MSTAPAIHETPPAELRKIATASVVGTTIEFYDLFIFATASALVFNKAFFPSFDPLVGTMLAFGTFATAYIARILGAAVFGHFGDRIGRKATLLVSLVLMGVATFAIGLLPDYGAIGVAAPLLLLVCRLLQGFALGGEWGGAVLMVIEHSPARKRSFFGSLVQVGVPAGTLLANLVFLVMALIVSDEAFAAWGWRVPFLASIVLVVVGLWIRLKMHETPAFQQVRQEQASVRLPFVQLLKDHWREVLVGAFAIQSTGTFNILIAVLAAYGRTQLGYTNSQVLWATVCGLAVALVAIPYFGRLGDRIGDRNVMIGGIVAQALLIFPLIMLMNTRSLAGLILGYVLMLLAFSANFAPVAALLADLFTTQVRYTGLSFTYMFGGLVGTVSMLLISSGILAATGSAAPIAWFVVAVCVISVFATLAVTRHFGGHLLAGRSAGAAHTLDTAGAS